MLLRLSILTRHWHADVDEPWLDLLRPRVGVPDYLGQLVRVYGLVAPFESACRYTPGIDAFLDVHALSRAGLIAKDLVSLGLSPAQVTNASSCPAITTFRSAPEAFGWLYVIERTTLLQEGIRRHLVRKLPQIEGACSYLAAQTSDHWDQIGRLIDRVGSTPDREDDVAAAAQAGFSVARGWLRPREELRMYG